MLKFFILLSLTILIVLPSIPAFCAGATRTMTLQLSVTIPPHVVFNAATAGAMALLSNAHQLVQIQNVVRNNRSIRLTSIVLP